MTSAVRTEDHLVAPSDSDRKNYQRLFRITFLLFLVLVLVGRLLPGTRRGASAEGEHESLTEEARRMSSTILPFVFIR